MGKTVREKLKEFPLERQKKIKERSTQLILEELEQIIKVFSRSYTAALLQSICKYNAHSSFLKCAVNPSGDCRSCPHFESKVQVLPDSQSPPNYAAGGVVGAARRE